MHNYNQGLIKLSYTATTASGASALWADESQREPKRDSEGQKGPKRANDYHYQRESQLEPERVRGTQKAPEIEPEWSQREPGRGRDYKPLFKRKRLWQISLAHFLAHPGFLWLALSLYGSNWLSVASTNTLCHSLAQSGSLWLSLAHYCSELRLYSPCSALSAAVTLTHILRSASAKCVTILKYLSKLNAL